LNSKHSYFKHDAKMGNKENHTVGIIPKSNQMSKMGERDNIDTS